jgi:hypothetical protein
VRYGVWICRLGTLVIGLVAGALYLIPHSHPFRQDDHGMFNSVDKHADLIALLVVIAVASWLLVSLAIARRLDKPRTRLVPGLIAAGIAGGVAAGAAAVEPWPVTAADAALVFGIGVLGSIGVLVAPGSLRENHWSKARFEHD